MDFNEEELYYLNRLLSKHMLDLIDLIMHEEDKDLVREIMKINKSCMKKINLKSNEK